MKKETCFQRPKSNLTVSCFERSTFQLWVVSIEGVQSTLAELTSILASCDKRGQENSNLSTIKLIQD